MRVNSLPSPFFPNLLCLLHRTRLKAETHSKMMPRWEKAGARSKPFQPGAQHHNLHVPRNSASPPCKLAAMPAAGWAQGSATGDEGESDSWKKARQCETLQELIKKNKQTWATETGITVASSEASWAPAQRLRKTHRKAFPRISSAKNLCNAPGHTWGGQEETSAQLPSTHLVSQHHLLQPCQKTCLGIFIYFFFNITFFHGEMLIYQESIFNGNVSNLMQFSAQNELSITTSEKA